MVLGQPQDLAAQEQGYRLLGQSTESVPELLYTVTAARRSWAELNKAALVRYVRAFAAALEFVRDPINRDHVARIIMQNTSSSETIARQTLSLF